MDPLEPSLPNPSVSNPNAAGSQPVELPGAHADISQGQEGVHFMANLNSVGMQHNMAASTNNSYDAGMVSYGSIPSRFEFTWRRTFLCTL